MNNRTQGYVLPTVLISLIVVSGMAAMTINLTLSETRQSGGNQMVAQVRAAAEAAQGDALFYMSNQGLSDVNVILAPFADAFANSSGDASTQAIIPKTSYALILASLNAVAGTTITGAANSVTYSGKVTYTSMNVDEKSFSSGGQTYIMNYTITGSGQKNTLSTRTVTTNGQMQVKMGRQFLNQFVLLANDGGSQQGNFFATGMNYDGPVQINQNWRFAGKPKFKYGVTTASSNVQMSPDCDPSNNDTVSTQSNNCTVPDWGGFGIVYAAPKIDLPKNAASQQKAALGLDPKDTTTTVSTLQECQALGANFSTCGGTVPNGVYVPYNAAGNLTGGIYIKGDANSIALSVSGNKQIYTITDVNNVVTTITVDYTAKTTTVMKGGVTKVLNGVLSGEAKSPGQPSGMIYSTGSIKSLGGPVRTSSTLSSPVPAVPDPTKIPPAVATNSVINISAASDMVLQSDLTYEQDPRTTPGAKNVLGLMAGGGSVRIGTGAPKDVYVQAALLAGAQGKGFAVDSYGNGVLRGDIHLLGSLAEDTEPPRGVGQQNAAKNDIIVTSGYGDAFNFDPRFLNGGAVPPFFPSTSKFAAQAVWPSQQGWQEK